MKRLAALCLAAALLAGCAAPPAPAPPPSATAQPPAAPALPVLDGARWQAIADGLMYTRLSPWPDAVVHLLRVDLHAPGLRLALTPQAERGAALDRMPSALAALAAVNASFFDRQFRARGWSVSEGQVWPEPLALGSGAATPLLACDARQRCAVHFTLPAAPQPAWHTAVSGTPWLLRGGRPREPADDVACGALCSNEHPRTVVGLDVHKRWLWLVAAEGRRPPVAGLRLAPLAQWLRGLGVHDAINLDGGGSSALLLRGQAVMARPFNEPAQRVVANGLLVLQRQSAEAAP